MVGYSPWGHREGTCLSMHAGVMEFLPKTSLRAYPYFRPRTPLEVAQKYGNCSLVLE